ncbi:hypothetical protein Pmani_024004 [Petrolisthes manimaculis]|uniref:Uncharacterized protein n=1 Tax=Petrolisthes manimaculis TaxID=1843537 RepID=A0AAE1TZ47_9EUCA|nr:hypothetical protein Pmani_024004 [Petrolisthes manimaculis]
MRPAWRLITRTLAGWLAGLNWNYTVLIAGTTILAAGTIILIAGTTVLIAGTIILAAGTTALIAVTIILAAGTTILAAGTTLCLLELKYWLLKQL